MFYSWGALQIAFIFLIMAGKDSLAQWSGSLGPDNNFNLGTSHRLAGNNNEKLQASVDLSGNTKGGPVKGNWNVDYNKGLSNVGVFGSHTVPGSQNTFGARGNLNLVNDNTNRLDVNAFGSQSSNNFKQFGAGFNLNGHGASLTKSDQPGVATQTRLDGNVNVFKSSSNQLDVNAFKSNTNWVGGPTVGAHGAGLNWNNANGHGASVKFERTPMLKETNVFGSGKANLWQSTDRQTSLDAFGTVGRTLTGPNKGNSNFGAGVGLTHRF